MGSLVHARVFLKDSRGRVIARRPGVWSSRFDACQGCGTTERPHEARGLCHNCYVRWRYEHNAGGCADRQRRYNKRRRMTDPEAETKDREKAERVKNDPRLLAMRQVVSNRYADKVSRWPRGTHVEVSMANLAHWSPTGKAPRKAQEGGIRLKGEIVDKTNTRALVRFATFEEWVPFARLTMIERGSREAAHG